MVYRDRHINSNGTACVLLYSKHQLKTDLASQCLRHILIIHRPPRSSACQLAKAWIRGRHRADPQELQPCMQQNMQQIFFDNSVVVHTLGICMRKDLCELGNLGLFFPWTLFVC